MKKLNLKKLLSLTAAVALPLSLAACSGGTASSPSPSASAPAGSAPAAGEGYKVAVVKQLDHASMDEIANAITGRLDEIAAEKGAEITYQVFSGQNDQSLSLIHILWPCQPTTVRAVSRELSTASSAHSAAARKGPSSFSSWKAETGRTAFSA